MLLHDVADDVNYGSVRFWKEVSINLTHFVFQHSWGLGVLFPKSNIYYQQIIAHCFDEKMKIYEYRSELEYARIYLDDLGKKIAVLEAEKKNHARIESSFVFRIAAALNRNFWV